MNQQTKQSVPRKSKTEVIPFISTNKIVPIETKTENSRAKIICITSFPPRECGIATYSKDLIAALNEKFDRSFDILVCALESNQEKHDYEETIKYTLNTDHAPSYVKLAQSINTDPKIGLVMLQHEFGFFRNLENEFLKFTSTLTKPLVIAFHTVLPKPAMALRNNVIAIAENATAITVMTHSSATILMRDYGIEPEKIQVIPHGTHLVHHKPKGMLKKRYGLSGKKILSTFGLLGPGKSIETTLDALPEIIKKHDDCLFLIIGKTHPTLQLAEGEKYRDFLKAKIKALHLEKHTQFIDEFVALPKLLDYLQLSDIYLFTSKDPNQAVSGTFSYAMSCGCPIISTPIPHAKEALKEDTGIVVGFSSPGELSQAVIRLLDDAPLRKNMGHNGLLHSASTAWENAAIAHAQLFRNISSVPVKLNYNKPELNLEHAKKMTTNFGMLQFSVINQPDPLSGYTLDDNARALITFCKHYKLTQDPKDLDFIQVYLDFILYCYQGKKGFYNYVDIDRKFTDQNDDVNLEDANGRAIWALGYFLSIAKLLPANHSFMIKNAKNLMDTALIDMHNIHSTRAMAFIIKGLYYYNKKEENLENTLLISTMADRMVQMYRHESGSAWQWFESYFTYANSIMPEALLLAYKITGTMSYKKIAQKSFDFLLSNIFINNSLKLIPNKSWLLKSDLPQARAMGGEQPIDVAYTIMALKIFNKEFPDSGYDRRMQAAFDWFLGKNHLQQILYNPCTGGCYDGLEDAYVNLNQGAESTISYLLSRMVFSISEITTNKINGPKSAKIKA